MFLIKKEKSSIKMLSKKLYFEVGIYILKYTNFHKISPKETQEKWARVFFVCMLVTS